MEKESLYKLNSKHLPLTLKNVKSLQTPHLFLATSIWEVIISDNYYKKKLSHGPLDMPMRKLMLTPMTDTQILTT